MNDDQQTTLNEALHFLNRAKKLIDLAYGQNERTREGLSPGSEDEDALDDECSALTIILGDIEGAKEATLSGTTGTKDEVGRSGSSKSLG